MEAPPSEPPPPPSSDEESVGLAALWPDTSRTGAAPGIETHELSLIGSGPSDVRVSCVDYGLDDCAFQAIDDVNAFVAGHRPEWSAVRWIRVSGLTDMGVIRAIAEKYALHPLAIEDLLHLGQRPKVEDYPASPEHPGRMFIVAQLVRWVGGVLRTEQMSFFLGRRTLISFHPREEDLFDQIDHRLRSRNSRLRRHDASFLLHALLDAIVDQFFPVLEGFSARLEELEETVLVGGKPEVLRDIHRAKHDLVLLRRTAWPMRELVSQLHRDHHEGLSETTRTYMRDVYDNLIQILDLLETYREFLTSLTETHLSTVSQRLNDIVKTLTIISTIFVPLTFFAGVYGMNMPIPENESEWSYPLFWGFCFVLVGGMLYMFRRRGWL
ncbi:magnesium/cobalt transporter CorA [Methylolobus aquaticus]|nr:magnesium/cobalt transporter CorA [Methylolobus aquaticus]